MSCGFLLALDRPEQLQRTRKGDAVAGIGQNRVFVDPSAAKCYALKVPKQVTKGQGHGYPGHISEVLVFIR